MVGGFARINYSLAHGGGRVDIKHRLDVCCLRQRIIETAGIQASEPDVARERDGGGGRRYCRCHGTSHGAALGHDTALGQWPMPDRQGPWAISAGGSTPGRPAWPCSSVTKEQPKRCCPSPGKRRFAQMVTIPPRDEEDEEGREGEASEGERDEGEGDEWGADPPQEIYKGEAGGGPSPGRDVG